MWSMIPKEKIEELKQALLSSEKQIFFFDDDPDGLCSFLLLYRLIEKGKGVIVKQTPLLDSSFLRKVDEYGPDKVFILDIPRVNQELFDALAERKIDTYWLDHHPPQ